MFGYRILGLGGSHPNRGGGGRVTITLTISSDVNNYDIQANRGGTYEAGNTDVILINNAHIKSTAANTHALQTGTSWTSGDTITIDNNSSITADGGNGGAGGSANSTSLTAGSAGGAGGFGISINYPVSIDNTGGTISGGGGGGGGGGSAYTSQGKTPDITTYSAGGGGGGAGTGQGGAAGSASGSNSNSNIQSHAGAAGSLTAGGEGGKQQNNVSLGKGGTGGGLGAAGAAGNSSDTNFPNRAAVGAGGAAGKAVNLNGNAITWIANGTRNGAIS